MCRQSRRVWAIRLPQRRIIVPPRNRLRLSGRDFAISSGQSENGVGYFEDQRQWGGRHCHWLSHRRLWVPNPRHVLHEMIRRDAKKGLASLCIGGGMGVALAVER